MFGKLFWLILFAYLNLIKCSPHLRRNSNYYHHRSPYHVNYSPYNLPKRTYFGVESSMYNDLDDSISNEPVKGGIKGSNPNHIKTPMKLFSERKNSFLTGGLSTLQEKFNEAKRASQSSIKQQQVSNLDRPIIYPNDNEFNDTPSLPILPSLNKKKTENSKKNSEKGSSIKSSSKTKITNQVDMPSNNINSNETVNNGNSQKVSPSIVEKPAVVEATKSNEIPIKAESNLEIKDSNILETKLASGSTTEQPATTTVPDLSPSKDLEIKEIKVDSISNSDVSISKLELTVTKPEEIKSEIKVEKLESTKLDIKNESVVKPTVADNKPIIYEKPVDNISNLSALDSKKSISANEKAIVNEEIIDKSPSIVSDLEIKSDINSLSTEIKKQNVDLPPKLSTNTENSLIENETNSPIIN